MILPPDYTPAPETLYRAAGERERVGLKAAVVAKYRGHVIKLARQVCPFPNRWPDAEQAGAEGLLVALDRFEPSTGAFFWSYAADWVRKHVQKFLNAGVYWRSTDGSRLDTERAAKWATHAFTQSLATEPPRSSLAPDEKVSKAECNARLEKFLESLSREDAHLLLCEKRDRGEVKNNSRSRRYEQLVKAARIAVIGKEEI